MAVSLNTALGAYPITALAGTNYVPLAGGTMTGALTLPAGAVGTPSLMFTGAGATTGIYSSAANEVSVAISGLQRLIISGSGVYAQTNTLGMSVDTGYVSLGASNDVRFYRDAAATLAQRNGTTQQIFRLYNTYTDSSNYERLTLTGVAGTSVNITAETLGTGADNLDIVLTPAGTGVLRIPTQTSIRTGSASGFVNLDFTSVVLRRGDGANAFGLLAFGGLTSSDPALKRSGSLLLARLADDSADAGFSALYVKTASTTVAALTAAATAGAGARAFVTDANATTDRSVVAGGGSNKVPVFSDGTNWLIG